MNSLGPIYLKVQIEAHLKRLLFHILVTFGVIKT